MIDQVSRAIAEQMQIVAAARTHFAVLAQSRDAIGAVIGKYGDSHNLTSADAMQTIDRLGPMIAELEERLGDYQTQLSTRGREFSDQYLNALFAAVRNGHPRVTATLGQQLPAVSAAIARGIQDGRLGPAQQFVQQYANLHTQIPQALQSYLDALRTFRHFEHFSGIHRNIVLIGANGAGKSTFSRRVKKHLGDNVAIVEAQKLLRFTPKSSIPLPQQALSKLHSTQAQEKLYDGFTTDFGILINALFARDVEHANLSRQAGRGEIPAPVAPLSELELVLDVWNSVIRHRKMDRVRALELEVRAGGATYALTQLSDGEKAVFFYAAHVLLAKPNSYIIIDEPETHLHAGIVAELWDRLERERPDCQFVYLTHNLEFAVSRSEAKLLWCRDYQHPDTWVVEQIPDIAELPKDLLLELLGARKRILFCEGDKNGRDFKLYSILFPDYTVVPVGGHLDVLAMAKAFNKVQGLHGNSAIGIIDGDYHLPEQVESWRDDGICCLPVNEVENLLCDETLLDAARMRFLAAKPDAVQMAKDLLFEKMRNGAEVHVIEYVTQRSNALLRGNMQPRVRSLDELRASLQRIATEHQVEDWAASRRRELDDAIQRRDYDRALGLYSLKGLVGQITHGIVPDYETRIFQLIRTRPDLIQALRTKYFSDIPHAAHPPAPADGH